MCVFCFLIFQCMSSCEHPQSIPECSKLITASAERAERKPGVQQTHIEHLSLSIYNI